jgi:hypothetical protein
VLLAIILPIGLSIVGFTIKTKTSDTSNIYQTFPASGQPATANNIFTNIMLGTYGGECECPDGKVYLVADHKDDCGSLACYGGRILNCNKIVDPKWTRNGVFCSELVAVDPIDHQISKGSNQPASSFGGICLCPSGYQYPIDSDVAGSRLHCIGGKMLGSWPVSLFWFTGYQGKIIACLTDHRDLYQKIEFVPAGDFTYSSTQCICPNNAEYTVSDTVGSCDNTEKLCKNGITSLCSTTEFNPTKMESTTIGPNSLALSRTIVELGQAQCTTNVNWEDKATLSIDDFWAA